MLSCSRASRAARTLGATPLPARIPKKCFARVGASASSKPGGKTVTFDGNPVEQLKRLTARYRPVRVPGMPPLTAGAIGYFAYDMVRLVERIPDTGRDDLGVDDCVMMFYLGLVAFDHVQHRVWIIRNVFTEGPGSLREKYDAAVREIGRTRKMLEQPLPPAETCAAREASAHHVEYDEAAIHRGGAQSEIVHSRGRCVSNRREPAIRGADERRSFRDLPRAARGESFALPLLPEARRRCRWSAARPRCW